MYDAGSVLFSVTGWLEGPKAIATFLSGSFTGPYRLKPATYRIDGANAQIAGYMVEGDATQAHFGFFHLNLRQAVDGGWRIASETQIFPGPPLENAFTAQQLVAKLDEAGIERGVVLSDAYYFALTPETLPGEYEKVRAENDWTAAQVAQFPRRLVAFFSVNPLRDYALPELERCVATGRFKGLKIHLNAAQLDFRSPEQVGKVRRLMEAANRHGLPMIIHVRSSNEYGREDAEVLLRELVAAAPDVPIQIAHLWGGESFSGTALAAYADAVAAGDPVAKHLYFDISGVAGWAKPAEIAEIVAGIRRIGLSRILYASDAPPAEAWQAFRKLPLTEEEFRIIAGNVAPYMRER